MRRGVWSPLLLGIIIAVLLLGIVLYFLFVRSGAITSFIQGLGDIASG